MEQAKKQQIAEALSDISYGDWLDISRLVEFSYHVTKKTLTSEEISARLLNGNIRSDDL